MIDSEKIWSQLRGHFSKEIRLKTIKTRREFKIVYDRSCDEIIVTPESSKMPRHITKSDFRKVWEKFITIKEEPYQLGHYQRETRNVSYILALIQDMQKVGSEKASFTIGEERKNLSKLKSVKGSFANIIKSSWDELEEAGDKFVNEEWR